MYVVISLGEGGDDEGAGASPLYREAGKPVRIGARAEVGIVVGAGCGSG